MHNRGTSAVHLSTIVFISIILFPAFMLPGCTGRSDTSESDSTIAATPDKTADAENPDTSELQSDDDNQPLLPGTPRLLGPRYHTTVTAPHVTFSWKTSGNAALYKIRVFDDFLPGKVPVFEADTDTNTWKNVTPLQKKNHFYFWQVAAVDKNNMRGNWSDMFVFYYTDTPDAKSSVNVLWKKMIYADVFTTDTLTAVPDAILSASSRDGSVFLLGTVEIIPDFLGKAENSRYGLCSSVVSPTGLSLPGTHITTGGYSVINGLTTMPDGKEFLAAFTRVWENRTFLISLDSEGKLISSFFLPLPTQNHPKDFLIRKTADNRILCAAAEEESAGSLHIMNIAPGPDKVLWHSITSIDRTDNRTFDDMAAGPDNSIVIAFKTGKNSYSGECDYISLYKCNASGEPVWDRMITIDPQNPAAKTIACEPEISLHINDDGIITALFSAMGKAAAGEQSGSRTIGLGVIKVSPDGNINESRVINPADFDSIDAFCTLDENEFAVFGRYNDVYAAGIISGTIDSDMTLRIIGQFPVIDKAYCSKWEADISRTKDNNLLVSGRIMIGENYFPCNWFAKISRQGKPLSENAVATVPAGIRISGNYHILHFMGFDKKTTQAEQVLETLPAEEQRGLAFADSIPGEPDKCVVYQWLKYLDINTYYDPSAGSGNAYLLYVSEPGMKDSRTGLAEKGLIQSGGGTILEYPDIKAKTVKTVYENEFIYYSTRSGLQTVIGDYQGYWYRVSSIDRMSGWLHGLVYTPPTF